MKPSRSFRDVLFLAAVFAMSIASVRAENWQDTRHVTLIDVDSIYKGADGLVYFMEKQKYHDEENGPNTPHKAAVDCVRRVSYSAYSIEYESDWPTKGQPVNPGTMGAELLDFVCSRVR
ncbi:MAG: hypothetical protein ACKVRO_02490 [Micropepsaceae bacterium]